MRDFLGELPGTLTTPLLKNEAPRAKARGFLPACPSGEIPTDSIRGLKAAVLKRRDKPQLC